MKFLNRINEKQLLTKALHPKGGGFIVIYGRRRCGKSTLIKNNLNNTDVYFMAQQTEATIQRSQMASAIAEKLIGFDKVVYPDWESLFFNLNQVLKETVTICIDEFPYLVKSDPGLPSVLQKIIDTKLNSHYNMILCGSSQQMMHGLILDSSAPLYGRANAIMKIQPLESGWIQEALACTAQQAIEEYSVWGGIPRYWELRSSEDSLENGIKNIILSRYGVLHDEPSRLFLDDMRESVQAFSILSIVGSGCNRISEIASRLNKPANQLARPIENLIQLGYLKREIPFGEHEKNSKKGVYKIAEPFMNFYFSFVSPNISRLELNLTDLVFSVFNTKSSGYIALEWENLCRRSIPMQPINEVNFDVAYRWWGTNTKNQPMEIDVVAESIDKKYLFVGECKWSAVNETVSLLENLKQKANTLPFVKGKTIIPYLFVKAYKTGNNVMDAADVLKRLKR
jgi:uncharacterized protein